MPRFPHDIACHFASGRFRVRSAYCRGGKSAAGLGILLLILSLLAGSCDRRSEAPPPPKVDHPGTLSGRITFSGTPPRLPPLAVTGDPHCVAAHAGGIADESVVVGTDGAIANVFVFLKDAPRSDGSARPPASIDQSGCRYIPHAVAVQINQGLNVSNSDPVFHNVHVLAIENPAMNLAEPQPGQQTVKFALPEIIRLRCDVHPWMTATLRVFEHPWFCVTGADGKFQIPDVPPGNYTLAVWHERFGELTRKITVQPDGRIMEDFSYAP